MITSVLKRDPLLMPLHVRLDHAHDESGASGVTSSIRASSSPSNIAS